MCKAYMLYTYLDMRISVFDQSKEKIIDFFDRNDRRAFTIKSFEKVFNDNRAQWGIPINRAPMRLLEYLVNKSLFHPFVFTQEQSNERITIYSWKSQNELTIINGLKNNSYFTHYTSLYLHSLTEQIPKTIYLNYERSQISNLSSSGSTLTQSAIDKAFANDQRKSHDLYIFKDLKIYVLNGKFTDHLGVTRNEGEDQQYYYTDLERTLVDISIRPAYSGGVFEVLEAYKRSEHRVDPVKLRTYLTGLDYIYPYHQVIGFYLEKAGYSQDAIKLFEGNMIHNFYLTYGMRNPVLNSKWKLFIPKGF